MRKPDLEIFREALRTIANQSDDDVARRDAGHFSRSVARAALQYTETTSALEVATKKITKDMPLDVPVRNRKPGKGWSI